MFIAHLSLSDKVHSHELPHEPLRGRFEKITPIPIKMTNINIKIIEIKIVAIGL